MVEHRQEQRAQRDLAVHVSGRDANGNTFSQSVNASNISKGGALLSGLSSRVRPGDLVLGGIRGPKGSFQNRVGKRFALGSEVSGCRPQAGEGRVSVVDIEYSF